MEVRRLKPDELQHHGVKGQQWGVRHGPPYPIEDKILRKGSKLNTVVASNSRQDNTDPEKYRKAHNKNWLYTYNNEHDQKIYKGPFAKYLVNSKGAQYLDEHKYVVIKDLKMPTKEQRVDEFVNVCNKDAKQATKDLKSIQKMLVYYKVGNEQEQKDYKNFDADNFDPSNKKQLNVAYSMFNHMMEMPNNFSTTKTYIKNMEKKYDAMVDDNNQGIYNNALDPIIVFKANAVLQTVGSEHITAKDVIDNYNEVKKEMDNMGRKVKL